MTAQKRELEASLRKLADELGNLEPIVLEDLALAGMTSATVNGMTLYQQREFFAGLKPDVDKQEALRSFLDEGHADLVMLGWQGLRALVRALDEEDNPPAPDYRPVYDPLDAYPVFGDAPDLTKLVKGD